MEGGSPSLRAELAARLRSEALWGGVALALLLVAFLWTPISRYHEVHYSSADLLQDYSLTRVEPGYPAINKLMSDEVTQMQAWAMFNRDELAADRVPWWNPWNGTGAPHFANYQSAVFSIFSLPWYVLSAKAALLVTSFLKLWLCGFFTFLFAKKLRLAFVPALVGACAFMFGGHNVLLLSFPHVGAQAVLPAGLYFAECVLQRAEGVRLGSEARSLRLPLTGLALTFALGLLAGQPEVFYFSFGLIACFIAARLLWILRRDRHVARTFQKLLGVAGKLCFAGLVGAGLAAFQLLPFFEFLENSRLYEQRNLVQTPLSTAYWPLMVFPDLLGNPSSPYFLSYHVPEPNYELVNMAYAGALVVFLALVALVFARRDKYLLFFALAGAAWLFYAYDLFGAASVFAWIPTLGIAPMNRSQGVWLFCLAILAAKAVDHLLRGAPRARWLPAAATLGAAVVFLTTFLIGADRVLIANGSIESSNHAKFALHVPRHVEWMSQLFAAGVLAVVLMLLVRWRAVRHVAALALLAATFLASGGLLRDYNPCTEDRLFFPVTPAVRELAARVGDERLAILGEDKLPPDVNMTYRVQSVSNYDGMWVQKYDHLYRDQFGDTGNWRPMIKASERALKLFGVQWVLAKWGWNFADSGFNPLNRAAGQKFTIHEIVPGGTVTQTIRAHKDRLQAIAVFLSVPRSARGTHVDFALEEPGTGKLVAKQRMRVEEIRSTLLTSAHLAFTTDYQVSLPGRNVVFAFDPIPDSRGKTYRLVLSSDDAQGTGNCAHAWSAPLLAYGEGQATWRGKPLKGELLFDFSYNLDRFEDVARIGDYVLQRYTGALPPVHAVRGAVVAESDEEALALLRVPSFDPADIVVLSDDATLPPEVRQELGPVDHAHRRLVKFEGDDKVYLVQDEARRLVHIQNEVVFLVNKFQWSQIQSVQAAEFEGWPRTFEDMQAQLDAGLRVVTPDVKGQERLEVLERSPTRTVVDLARPFPGYVVFSQAWFPGWKARVDGAEVPVWRANYAFNAVAVPAGRHRIELVYAPGSLRIGAWIGVVSLLVGLAALVRRTRGL